VEADSRAVAYERHASQASRQAKRRQAAALQNGLAARTMCEGEGSNRGQRLARDARLNGGGPLRVDDAIDVLASWGAASSAPTRI